MSNQAWGLLALLILSGLASLIAFSRLGIQRFWTPQERPSPLLRPFECLPIIVLLGLGIALTFKAETLLRYTQSAADALNNPEHYVMSVLATRAVPNPEARAALRRCSHEAPVSRPVAVPGAVLAVAGVERVRQRRPSAAGRRIGLPGAADDAPVATAAHPYPATVGGIALVSAGGP